MNNVVPDIIKCFLGGTSGKEPTCQGRRHKRGRFDSWAKRSPGGGNGNPLQLFIPREFHRQKSLVGYGPKDPKELDILEQLSTDTCTYDINIK